MNSTFRGEERRGGGGNDYTLWSIKQSTSSVSILFFPSGLFAIDGCFSSESEMWIDVGSIRLFVSFAGKGEGDDEEDDEEAGSDDKIEDLDRLNEVGDIPDDFKKVKKNVSSTNQVPVGNNNDNKMVLPYYFFVL